jgi:hypothetical protein
MRITEHGRYYIVFVFLVAGWSVGSMTVRADGNNAYAMV